MSEKYKVIDEKIIPTFKNNELAIVYVKMLKEEVSGAAAASSFSASLTSATSSSSNNKKFAVAVSIKDDIYVGINDVPSVLFGDISDEQVNKVLDLITDGMKEGNATKVKDALRASSSIINVDEVVDDYMWSDSEIETLKSASAQIYEDFEKLKSNESASSASEGKLGHYAFRKHLLIQGEKGGGKTYMVDKLIKDKGYKSEFIGGHEAIEAIDFLGYYIKTNTGSLVWKDGGLTSAFRRAAKGEKIVLFIDEMLRIPKRELNILVAALTPDSSGNFNLRTSRAIDVASDAGGTDIANEEVITIPASNLWAIGTTNAGAGYSVDTIDEALADRFRTIIKTTSEKELKIIVSGYVKDKGFDKSITNKLFTFYKQFHDMKKSGELTKVLNIRHLVEVVMLADNESQIIDMLNDLIPTLTTMDVHGMPNESQSAIIETLLEKSGL